MGALCLSCLNCQVLDCWHHHVCILGYSPSLPTVRVRHDTVYLSCLRSVCVDVCSDLMRKYRSVVCCAVAPCGWIDWVSVLVARIQKEIETVCIAGVEAVLFGGRDSPFCSWMPCLGCAAFEYLTGVWGFFGLESGRFSMLHKVKSSGPPDAKGRCNTWSLDFACTGLGRAVRPI